MTDKEIKTRLANWNAKTTTALTSEDPERYTATVILTMYGVDYRTSATAETKAEAAKIARNLMSLKAL